MGEAKPTPGPCYADGQVVHSDAVTCIAKFGDAYPDRRWSGSDFATEAHKDANAELFADALNVLTDTGLTPSQLVDRVKDLEELLNGVLLMGRGTSGRIIVEGWQEEVLRSALSKARPNTAEGEAAQQAPAAGAVAGPTDYVPMLDDEGRMMVGTSHHYTAANIRALVAEYKALEAGAPEALERYSNSDHRTRAGVLWRVISALADEVPIAAQADSQPAPRWNDFAGDLSKQGQLVITLENVNEGKQWHATSNHSERIVVGQFDAQEALRLALENAGNKAGAA